MKTWFLNNRIAMVQAFFAALVIPCTWALTALGIYFANIMEIPGNPVPVSITVFVLVSIVVSLLFLVQLPFLGHKFFPWIAVTLLTFGLLLWFQANVFNWNFGVLDGREIDWKSLGLVTLGIFELFVYGAIFFLAFRFKDKLLERIVPIAGVLVLMQVIPVVLVAVQTGASETTLQAEQTDESPHDIRIPSWKQYTMTLDGLFEFSQEENVVLVILDSLGHVLFECIQKDHAEEIEEMFRDFVCFTHAKCDRIHTRYNVPQILTGCSTEEIPEFISATFQHRVFNQNGALLKALSENQYRCDVFAKELYFDSRWIANIRLHSRDDYQESIPGGYELSAGISDLAYLTALRSMPTLGKRKALEDKRLRMFVSSFEKFAYRQTNRAETSYRPIGSCSLEDWEFNALVSSVSSISNTNQRAFKFIHLNGAHTPYCMDENCMPAKLSGIEGLKRQALGSLRIARNILKLIKELDVYDQSLIVVMADHGPRKLEYIEGTPSTPKHPFFLIKRKHTQQSQMAYNDNPIHIRDTTPIILSELGILQGEEAFSPFEMPEALVNERRKQWESIWSKP